jgi:hypothetical protein
MGVLCCSILAFPGLSNLKEVIISVRIDLIGDSRRQTQLEIMLNGDCTPSLVPWSSGQDIGL